MTETIKTLLEPIQNRLNAQLPDAARMDAYYYGFSRTNVGAIDAILSAVAVAGKGAHHTDSWDDEETGWYYKNQPGLPSANSAVDLIQRTADLAARNLTTDQARLLAAIRAVVAEIADTDLETNEAQQGDLSDRILVAIESALSEAR